MWSVQNAKCSACNDQSSVLNVECSKSGCLINFVVCILQYDLCSVRCAVCSVLAEGEFYSWGSQKARICYYGVCLANTPWGDTPKAMVTLNLYNLTESVRWKWERGKGEGSNSTSKNNHPHSQWNTKLNSNGCHPNARFQAKDLGPRRPTRKPWQPLVNSVVNLFHEKLCFFYVGAL